ncbi:hypothetical protein [Nocardia crassostreae]|uniref:hypothetical protein n=1 Tax=Nocardia crassostreae TaxID=53428 RepID=UPI00083373DB|nr:hypothetical protein [Nocardia crassostreae]
MSRSLRTRISTAVVVGALGALLATGAALAQHEPRAVIHGRHALTASVTGEKPGNRCQLAGKSVSGPWETVAADGTVRLTLDAGGGKDVHVLCEDPARGDSSVHIVRAERTPHSGAPSPIRQILDSPLLGRG